MYSVSVIVPVRNEAAGIAELLGDLLAQSRAPVEVLVVDTGSTDATVGEIDKVAARDRRVRLLRAPGAMPGGGRNAALRAAVGEWIAFVDGGMRVEAEWLARLMAPIDRGDAVDVVLGGLEPAGETRAARAAALAFVPARRATPDGAGEWRGYCLPSSVVRASLARRVGGFPEELRSGEDLIFFQRIEPSAHVAYAPAATVRWRHAASPRAVWRRFRTYAEHSFRAGLMGDWFAPLRRRYLGLLATTGPLIPLSTMGLLLARAFVMQRRKPELVDAAALGRARQLVEVAFYLGIIDAATFAAWWHWTRNGRTRVDAPGAAFDDVTVPVAGRAGRHA